MSRRRRRIFGTDGVRGVANRYPMVPEVAMGLGRAVAQVFKGKGMARTRIVVGEDTRVSGHMFEAALAAGITSMGADVMLVGVLPTPGVAYMTTSMRADAGVAISASHNPYEDNGLKFFGGNGFKLPDEQEETMERFVLDPSAEFVVATGKGIGRAIRVDDAAGRYCVALKALFPGDLNLEGLKIAVDCANGAAYRLAPMVLTELGAEVVACGVEPNGWNINDECGAVHPSKLARIVVEKGCDLGLALDGDADRAILVDELGHIVDGDAVLAICALFLKSQGKLKGRGVVGTLMSNYALELLLKKNGIGLVRADVGDRYVVEAMLANGLNLGGEPSGHVVFLDDATTGDGILTFLKVVEVLLRTQKSLSEAARIYEPLPQVLVNVVVKSKPPLETLANTMRVLGEVKKTLGNKGRANVRYSGTSQVLRIMVEGEDEAQVRGLADALAEAVKADEI